MKLGDFDALKAEFDLIASKSATSDWQSIPIKHIKQIIDNAPTVPQVTVFAENASKEEIEDFKQELENVLKRPQGEWARHDEWVGGSYVGGFYHVNCPCEDGYYSKWETNFCPNCGSPMQKGGEE